jgi:hypothetical protein
MLITWIFVEKYNGFIGFSFENRCLFDEFQLFLCDFIDQTLKERFDIFFLVSEDQEIVSLLIVHMLQFD